MNTKQENSVGRGPIALEQALKESAKFTMLAEESFRSVDEKQKEVEREHEKQKQMHMVELQESLLVLEERLNLEQQRLREAPAYTMLSAMDAITHFYGSSLLRKSDWVGAYTGLESKLREHALENEYPVPVLIFSEVKKGGWEDDPVRIEHEFSLTFVEPSSDGNYFHAKSREREQSVHAFTNDVEMVVDSKLSLPGRSINVARDITYGELSGVYLTHGKELILASSLLPKGRSFLDVYEDESYAGRYEFQSIAKSHLIRPHELLPEDENADIFFEYTVGWEELEKKVLTYEYEEREQVVENLLYCFECNGQEHFGGVNTPLGDLFEHIVEARKVQQKISTECSRRIQELS